MQKYKKKIKHQRKNLLFFIFFMIFIIKLLIMGCGCKSNTGIKKQVTQITKKSENTHNVSKSVNKPVRKQIIIRRPSY